MGIGHGEEPGGAGAEQHRGYRDEGVGGVEVATEQEPGHQRPEAAATEAPFLQLVEVAAAPARGKESDDGDEGEQRGKNGNGGAIGRHCCPRSSLR
jgi:hypothetical protein